MIAVEAIQFFDHHFNRATAHIGDIRIFVAKHALPRANTASDNRRHTRRSPVTFRLQWPIKFLAQFVAGRLWPQRAVDLRPLGHTLGPHTEGHPLKLIRVLHEIDNRVLTRPLANLVEFGHGQHFVQGDGGVHAAHQNQTSWVDFFKYFC